MLGDPLLKLAAGLVDASHHGDEPHAPDSAGIFGVCGAEIDA
jgi:hypothetical protein